MNILLNVEHFEEPEIKAFVVCVAESTKYKAMWALRSLEDRINEEKCQIVISVSLEKPAHFQLNNCSKELQKEITDILIETKFKSDLLT